MIAVCFLLKKPFKARSSFRGGSAGGVGRKCRARVERMFLLGPKIDDPVCECDILFDMRTELLSGLRYYIIQSQTAEKGSMSFFLNFFSCCVPVSSVTAIS